nr:MAG TPA: hypothetical protein [Bacteriophage sp.]
MRKKSKPDESLVTIETIILYKLDEDLMMM